MAVATTAAVIGIGAIAATTAYLFTNINQQTLDSGNETTQTAVSMCTKTTVNQNININDSTFIAVCRKDATNTGISISQTAAIEADCYLSNLIQSASDFALKLTNDQKTGLGMNVNATDIDIQNSLKQLTFDYCGGASSSSNVNLNGVTVIGCPITIAQNGSLQTQCSIEVVQQAILTMCIELDNQQSGLGIIQVIVGIILLLIVLGIVGVGVVALLKATSNSSSGNQTQKGGQKQGGSSVLYALIILAILILVIAVIGWATNGLESSHNGQDNTLTGWHRRRMLRKYIREKAVFKLNKQGVMDWDYYLGRYHARMKGVESPEEKPTGCGCSAAKQTKTVQSKPVSHPASFRYGQPPAPEPTHHYSDYDDFSFSSSDDLSGCAAILSLDDLSLSPTPSCTRLV